VCRSNRANPSVGNDVVKAIRMVRVIQTCKGNDFSANMQIFALMRGMRKELLEDFLFLFVYVKKK
jgi:hypothetical protein